MLKPLDGSPMISDNCWKAILDALNARAKSGEIVRCLEWGGGNSTIGFIKNALKRKNAFELVSVEHQTKFFPYLAESVMNVFWKSKYKTDLKISWEPLNSRKIKLRQLKDILIRHNRLKSASLNWQILTGNKRVQYAEQFKPDFSPSIYKRGRQFAKLALVTLAYIEWLSQAVIKSFSENSVEEYLEQRVHEDFFAKQFAANPEAGCLRIESPRITVMLWHIPEIRNIFWDRGVLLEGSIFQLPDFVDAPIEGKFDVIFIDGRARVPCIKRVYFDGLLKEGGSLFVHDAYRSEMAEAFKLFGPTPTFLYGSNITLNGSQRCAEDFGFPLVKVGDNLDGLELRIAQELFIYKN